MNYSRLIKKNKLWAFMCLLAFGMSLFCLYSYFSDTSTDFINQVTEVEGVLESAGENPLTERYILKLQGEPEMNYCIWNIIDIDFSQMEKLKCGENVSFMAIVDYEYQSSDIYQLTVGDKELISIEDAVDAAKENTRYALYCAITFFICFIGMLWIPIKYNMLQ